MSSGSNDGSEVVEMPEKDVARDPITTIVAGVVDTSYYYKLGSNLKKKHIDATNEVAILADIKTSSRKEVVYMGLSWEHAKRKAIHLAPLLIKTREDHHVWNRAREALKKKKEAIKKSSNRKTKGSKRAKNKHKSGTA